MTTDPVSLTARLRSSRVRRRDVLIGGAVGAAIVLAPPIRARATMPAGLGRAIRELMAAGRLPGLSAAVVRGGEVVWSHAWGMANIEAGRRATPDTLFMLASVSKTVVATAVLQAIEDDLFGLDTHVNDVLPVLRSQPRPPGRADHRPSAPHAHVEHPRQLDAVDRVLRGRRRGRWSCGRSSVATWLRAAQTWRRTTTTRSAPGVPIGTRTWASASRRSSWRPPPASASTRGASGGSSRLSAWIAPGGTWPDFLGQRSRCRTRGRGIGTRTCRRGSTATRTTRTARSGRRPRSSPGTWGW